MIHTSALKLEFYDSQNVIELKSYKFFKNGPKWEK